MTLAAVPDTFDGARGALLQLLLRLSYEERDVVLSSGQRSTFYIDCKQTVLTGRGHVWVGRCLLELVQRAEADNPSAGAFGACGGLTLGADPLASALALTAALRGRDLNAIYVRKEPKGHGTGAYLEGTKAVAEGARVVVVEDVVTTGNASLIAASRLREHGYQVDTVLTLVDREAGGREALAAQGLRLYALLTVADFRAAAHKSSEA